MQKKASRFYQYGCVVPFEEDSTHEFKAHKNFCVEDLPKWAFIKGTMHRSRKPVSRALNGFLNTGVGGVVYLGILDCGVVKGLQLTDHQKDHVKLALGDLMRRYQPVVRKTQYKIEFVPVISEGAAGVQLNDSGYLSSGPSSPASSDKSPPSKERKSHKLRCPSFCWCDLKASSLQMEGVKIPSYVVEITVHPFVYRSDVDPKVLQLHPLYEDEEERVYFRGAASLHSMTHQEVAEMTRRQARDHFEKVLKNLRKKLLHYEKMLASKHDLDEM